MANEGMEKVSDRWKGRNGRCAKGEIDRYMNVWQLSKGRKYQTDRNEGMTGE